MFNHGTFTVSFLIPEKNEYWVSEPILINESDNDLKEKLRWYFKDNFGTDIDVTSAATSVNGKITRTFRIKLIEPIATVSFDIYGIHHLTADEHLADTTLIGTTTWANLKATAMAEDYDVNDLTDHCEHKLVSALIAAQT